MRQTRRRFLQTTATSAGLGIGSVAFPAVVRGQSKKLVVWWDRSYYKEEDEALLKIAEEFGKARNVDVDVTLTIQEDSRNKMIGALTAKRGPDVGYYVFNDWEVMPRFAWDGQLVETTDVINELMPRYIEKFLTVAYCWDNRAKRRAYYGVPFQVQTIQTHYWKDLVREAGLPDDPGKIPMRWDEHWSFWKKAQDSLRKKDPGKYAKVYGVGMTESSSATDTIWNFEMALLSYGGQVFSEDGKVVAGQPKNKAAMVAALKFLTGLFASGHVPPDTVNWSDGDNNANFHSKSIIMTPNPSVSIPGHQYFEAPDNYFNRTATVEWPDGPDGRKPTYMVAVKTVIFPKASANNDPDLAKAFVKFMLESKRLAGYLRSTNGRWFPAFKDVVADPFFARGRTGPKGESDPHVPIVTRIYLERNMKVFDNWKTPANSQVYAENVWGKAMDRIIVDKWSAEKAAAEAIARVNTIAAQWNR